MFLVVFPNAIVLLARKKIWPPRRKLHKPVSFVYAIRGRNEAQELFLIPVVPEIARRAVTGAGRDAARVSPVFHRSREKKSDLEKYRFIILSIELLLRRRKMLPYTISEIIEIIIKKSKEKLKKIPSTLMVAFYFSLSAICTYPSPVLIPCPP